MKSLHPDQDLSTSLQSQVVEATRLGRPLAIVGSGSKSFYGRYVVGETLAVSEHRGIVRHEPTELILTARTGTPLVEIEAMLAEHGQMLGFEPPHFGPGATLGGAIACGLSGPRRPWTGSARDFVLGVRIINGRGEILRFGGEVMKNVAGFDLSRLMVGALGGLGVLLEVSLKVLPRPEAEITKLFELDEAAAMSRAHRWAAQCWPLSAVCYDGAYLYVRLSGADAAVRESSATLGGEELAEPECFWANLREQRLAFFTGEENLWRLSLSPATRPLPLPGPCFIDWGGAQRWLRTDAHAERVFETARDLGGHATLFRTQDQAGQRFQPLPEPLREIHIQLKRAFDPHGIFNPGRLYPDC